MVTRNAILMEALDVQVTPEKVASEIKKCLNTCKLTNYKSEQECSRFFSVFFSNIVEDGVIMTTDQWATVYNILLNDEAFMSNLCYYITMYQPKSYQGIFKPITVLVESELSTTKKKVRYLSNIRMMFTFIQMRLGSVCETVKAQINNPDALLFTNNIETALTTLVIKYSNMIRDEVVKENEKLSKAPLNEPVVAELDESVIEILDLLENADEYIGKLQSDFMKAAMNESIINTAKEKLNQSLVAARKADKAFGDLMATKWKGYREKKRNQKHSEMVGESLRIHREIKRLIKAGGVGMLNPAWGMLYYIITTVFDRRTDKRDRDILVADIKDELEIIEEKIAQAERNGDDKAKVELIRFRQKLSREYERINRIRFDPNKRK